MKKPGRIKSMLLEWIGVPVGLTDDAFWKALDNRRVAGQAINEASVMSLAAVWSCVRLIAETISTLPLNLYERTPDGRKIANTHPLYNLIHTQPNIDSTATVFWEAIIISMLMRGNGFAEKLYIGTRLVSIAFLRRDRLRVTKVNGVRKYFYTNADGKEREIAADRIFRVPGFTVDGDWGVSAIEYGAGVFGSALAAQSAANSTFEKGMMPTVAYTVPGAVNPQQREEFRGTVKELSGALNAGNPVILENGMTAAALGIKPSDSQLLESRQFSVEEICRWFRVPPFMVGHTAGSTNWGTGIEQQMIGFLTFTLRPWLTRVEQAITKELLAPGDRGKFYAEFSVEGLLRADSAGRMTYLSQAVNNGLMSRDEARAKENLAPRGGNADVLTVQTALIPIDKLGTTAPVQKVPTNET